MALTPLLCAELIGWRSLVIVGEAMKLGHYGFGAAAHILAQVAECRGGRLRRDAAEPLDAAIILTTVGDLVLWR